MCKIIGLITTFHDEQGIQLWSTWKEHVALMYFLALSFVVKFGRRLDLVFSVKETVGVAIEGKLNFPLYNNIFSAYFLPIN